MIDDELDRNLQSIRIEDYILDKNLLIKDDMRKHASIYKDKTSDLNFSWSRSENLDEYETNTEDAGLLSQ